MAVRIALQCSEADAHLILSEDNTAARLLTRPGEAIYNDANGMIEGNNLFQVVWLSDERREKYLERIQEMRREREHPEAAADRLRGQPAGRGRARTRCSNELLRRTDWPEPPKADSAWLGDAIAIKDPTAVVFRPQSGSNLLIVGQNDEAALAMMMMAAVSIAAQHPPAGPQACRFYLLDGSPVDSPLSGQLGRLKDDPAAPGHERHLARPGRDLHRASPRRSSGARSPTSDDQAPIYIFIYDIQRFRDLRKSDDDFGYLALRRGQAGPAVEALRRHPPRRPAGGRPHDRLVRQREQPEPDASIARGCGNSRSASCSR